MVEVNISFSGSTLQHLLICEIQSKKLRFTFGVICAKKGKKQMASNRKKIIGHYRDYEEENRAISSRANKLEFHYTKKLLGEYISLNSTVIELGCGTGYYGMYFADKCAQYTGVDLSPDNIAVFNEKILISGKENVRALVGDAIALPEFSDNSFDIVLCMGPMYHLSRDERQYVFGECYRIAKNGATLAFAYINSIGAYAGWCINDEWRSLYPNAKANKHFLEYRTAYDNPDVFFLTSPEEMESDANQNNLEVIKNCGLDFFFAQSAINMMSDEQFTLYMELSDKMTNSPSCTGLSDHALMLCTK